MKRRRQDSDPPKSGDTEKKHIIDDGEKRTTSTPVGVRTRSQTKHLDGPPQELSSSTIHKGKSEKLSTSKASSNQKESVSNNDKNKNKKSLKQEGSKSTTSKLKSPQEPPSKSEMKKEEGVVTEEQSKEEPKEEMESTEKVKSDSQEAKGKSESENISTEIEQPPKESKVSKKESNNALGNIHEKDSPKKQLEKRPLMESDDEKANKKLDQKPSDDFNTPSKTTKIFGSSSIYGSGFEITKFLSSSSKGFLDSPSNQASNPESSRSIFGSTQKPNEASNPLSFGLTVNSKKPTNNSDKKTIHNSENVISEDSANSTDVKPVQLEKTTIITGEEDESTILQVKAKLYSMDESKQWKEKGVGPVRLNNNWKENTFRLVMRTEGALRLVLNCRIYPKMTVELTSDKYLRFASFNNNQSSNKISHYLLKFRTPNDATQFKIEVESCINKLSE